MPLPKTSMKTPAICQCTAMTGDQPNRRSKPAKGSAASHDTASAIAGTPLSDGWAFVSCGTWALVGLELEGPELGALARRYDFSNEGGAEGTIAFLKNVTGLWILDSCMEIWRKEGRVESHDRLGIVEHAAT